MNNARLLDGTILSSANLSDLKRRSAAVRSEPFSTTLRKASGEESPCRPIVPRPIRPLAVRKRNHAESLGAQMGQWIVKLLRSRFRLVPEKSLRIQETLALGERRFVSILHVDGRRYLIGGTASNVSLLASLDAAPAPSVAIQATPVPVAAESPQ
jgi:hypothetical protein